MAKKPDGGSAFPTTVHVYEKGMSLRDYFAAQALTGMLARPPEEGLSMMDRAITAYDYADAMLKARE
jgi:hypothetical protein